MVLQEFYCECEDTGYTGAVCHTSLNFKSCMHYKFAHPDSREAEDVVIDIKGEMMELMFVYQDVQDKLFDIDRYLLF